MEMLIKRKSAMTTLILKKKKMNFKENNVTKEKRSFKYDAGVRSSKGQNHEYLCT